MEPLSISASASSVRFSTAEGTQTTPGGIGEFGPLRLWPKHTTRRDATRTQLAKRHVVDVERVSGTSVPVTECPPGASRVGGGHSKATQRPCRHSTRQRGPGAERRRRNRLQQAKSQLWRLMGHMQPRPLAPVVGALASRKIRRGDVGRCVCGKPNVGCLRCDLIVLVACLVMVVVLVL